LFKPIAKPQQQTGYTAIVRERQPVTGSTEKPTTHCHHNQAGTHYYLPSDTASPPFGRHQLSYHIFIMPKQRNTLDICTQHKSINT